MQYVQRCPFPHSWVSVDTYEMVLISLILVVFLTGVVGNSLVVIAVTTTKSMQGGRKERCGRTMHKGCLSKVGSQVE